jgi:DNA polymerase-3 subunit delta'
MESLLAAYLPDLPSDERGRLLGLAEGSPGRALLLAGNEGLAVAALVDKILEDMPDLSPRRGYEVADALGRDDSRFSTFMDLLRAGLAASVRETVRGRGRPRAAAPGRAAPA